jgi:hypothetical protein
MGSGFGSDAFSTPTVLSLRIKLLRCPMCPPGLLSCRPSCGAWDGCLVREQGPEGLWGLQVRLGGVPGPRCGEGGLLMLDTDKGLAKDGRGFPGRTQ